MKAVTTSFSILFLFATFAIHPVFAQSSATTATAAVRQELYLHAFRSPSIGMEYRRANLGFHAGMYTTILERGEGSTEFFKSGITVYFGVRPGRRYEPFVGASYLRGLNRDYKNHNGAFLEGGIRYLLTDRLEARLGGGVLTSPGHDAKINPTIGFSYRLPLR